MDAVRRQLVFDEDFSICNWVYCLVDTANKPNKLSVILQPEGIMSREFYEVYPF
jgi:hypothetical protein